VKTYILKYALNKHTSGVPSSKGTLYPAPSGRFPNPVQQLCFVSSETVCFLVPLSMSFSTYSFTSCICPCSHIYEAEAQHHFRWRVLPSPQDWGSRRVADTSSIRLL